MHPQDGINKIKYDDKMIKSNAWHKQLKIFFNKAREIKHPVMYGDLMQVLLLE